MFDAAREGRSGERVFQVVCMYDPAYIAVGTVPAAHALHAFCLTLGTCFLVFSCLLGKDPQPIRRISSRASIAGLRG